jgi:hypothetical protein
MSDTKYPEWPPTEQQPALSYTSIQTFNACARKWHFQHLTAALQHPRKFDLIRQKTMLGANAMAGSVIDMTIDEAIRAYMATREWPTDLPRIARRIAREFEDFSNEWCYAVISGAKWPKRPSIRPLDMVYYDGALSFSFKKEVIDRTVACLRNFIQFMKDEDLYDADPAGWRLPEKGDNLPNPWFWSDTVPMYAKFDFAYVDDGRVTIIDWKSGKSDSGDYYARQQLLIYGMLAAVEWGYDLSAISLRAVWLYEGKWTLVKIDAEDALRLRASWRDLYEQQGLLVAEHRAAPFEYARIFPLTDDLHACRFCPFRSCEGFARLATLDHDTVVAMEEYGPSPLIVEGEF